MWNLLGPGIEPVSSALADGVLTTGPPEKSLGVLFNFFPFIFISWRLITLQYLVVFAIHWHESAMDLHVFPILIPPPASLSISSPWVFPVHQAQVLVSCGMLTLMRRNFRQCFQNRVEVSVHGINSFLGWVLIGQQPKIKFGIVCMSSMELSRWH